VDHAHAAGVKLEIQPLHPMFPADLSDAFVCEKLQKSKSAPRTEAAGYIGPIEVEMNEALRPATEMTR
jgi:hypothetical protein